jgi:hypothetical protein
MPLTKPRRTGSRAGRFNHLDALGGIELKAYRGDERASGTPATMSCADAYPRTTLTRPQPSRC